MVSFPALCDINNIVHRYMYYRCSMLDSAFPAFTYNQGISKDKSDTRKLGSTLMKAMLKEVNDLCDPAVKKDWSSTTHQQVRH